MSGDPRHMEKPAQSRIKPENDWNKEAPQRGIRLDLDQLMEDNPALATAKLKHSLKMNSETGCASKRKKLEKIGPHQPDAMEAYDEIRRGYDFIKLVRKKDLIKSQGCPPLARSARSIRWRKRELFLDAFAKIKENFVKVSSVPLALPSAG